MKFFGFIPVTLLVLLGLPSPLQSREEIPIVAWGPMIENYNQVLSLQRKTIYEITDLKTKGAHRNTASFIILMQAVKAGGMEVGFELIQAPNARRGVTMVRLGQAVALFTALWSTDFRDDVYQSSTIVSRGKTYKGIYCLPENKDLLGIRTREGLKNFTCISSKNWTVDWAILEQLELKELHSVPNWNMMFDMIKIRGYDFALLEFPTTSDNLSISEFGVTLIPVPGIKVALDDSRHFMISKRHLAGKRFYEALEKGLKILKRQGILRKLLSDVGVYREDLAHWKVISVR